MNFSCNGEIVWTKIAGQFRSDMQYSQYPKLQIWRSSSAEWYTWTGYEVVLKSSVCSVDPGTWTNVSAVYHCSLEENSYVSFQCGDFIGLELPLQKNATFLLYFTTQDGPTNTIYFLGNSTPFATENVLPQITLGIRNRSKLLSMWICVHVCIYHMHVWRCVFVIAATKVFIGSYGMSINDHRVAWCMMKSSKSSPNKI